MHSMLSLCGLRAGPSGKFLKIVALRLNLEAFQSHSHAILHGHLNANIVARFMCQLQHL